MDNDNTRPEPALFEMARYERSLEDLMQVRAEERAKWDSLVAAVTAGQEAPMSRLTQCLLEEAADFLDEQSEAWLPHASWARRMARHISDGEESGERLDALRRIRDAFSEYACVLGRLRRCEEKRLREEMRACQPG